MQTCWPFISRAHFFLQFEQFSVEFPPVKKKKKKSRFIILKNIHHAPTILFQCHTTLLWNNGAAKEQLRRKPRQWEQNLSGQLTQAAKD